MHHDVRATQLATLVDHLMLLVPILQNDADCTWTRHFVTCLDRAQSLADSFTQDDLNSLSSLVMNVYGGMCSFNDYVAYNSGGRPVDGFAGLCEQVYDAAQSLRVIETQT